MALSHDSYSSERCSSMSSKPLKKMVGRWNVLELSFEDLSKLACPLVGRACSTIMPWMICPMGIRSCLGP